MDQQQFLNSFIDNKSIQLTSILGSSTYGVVYLGQEIYTYRHYAVKCIPNNEFSENEAYIHSLLTGHQHILTLEKVIREQGHIFLVMEYATSGDLFSCLTQSPDLVGNPRMIRHLFLQILDAVQHCHDHLVAHRDLKPENILLLSNHRVKLADFGLSTVHLLSDEFNCGSTYYLSPECQAISFTTHPTLCYNTLSNDIWSLGVILINLVTGRNPWRQANLKDSSFANYVESPTHFFRTIFPGISKSFERILLGCFSLDVNKRMNLKELRSAVLRCKTFLNSPSCIQSLITPPPSLPLCFSSTMLAYVGNYTDEVSPL
ncbi:unnamed protein product [Rhizopus stolonifer]